MRYKLSDDEKEILENEIYKDTFVRAGLELKIAIHEFKCEVIEALENYWKRIVRIFNRKG